MRKVGVKMSFASVRKQAGLTQKELAEKMGVDQSAVSFWETGKRFPRGAKLLRLAEVLNCSIDELFGQEPRNSA